MSQMDIFKVDPAGGVLWLTAAESLLTARTYIQSLATGEYIVFDHRTQEKSYLTMPTASISDALMLESTDGPRNDMGTEG